ncbi:hypothetical protein OT109_02180 [Phycisphaeraceae bacterium D3-23]
MLAQSSSSTSSYLVFVLLTIATWGLYGIFLHKGQVEIADPVNGRYKAFLFVGIAYFLVAVLAPLVMLLITGSDWKLTGSGMAWSLIAGIVGAAGAFGVLLAFGAGGKPAVVMSLIFAGAPLVNAAVAITVAGQWGQVKPLFLLGIVLAAAGAYLIVTQKPKPIPHAKPQQTDHAANESSSGQA